MIDAAELCLVPYPKKVSAREGVFSWKGRRYIQLLSPEYPQMLVPAAVHSGFDREITASPMAPKDAIGLIIRLDECGSIPEEGYKLTIKPEGIEIVASHPAGAFYGAATLKQILRQCQDDLPCLSITDEPDLAARGVMLDISRDKVPTMETLFRIVDLLAEWKINQFQLYTEHTFAYLQHPAVWKDASPLTGSEIIELDSYCRSRFIELVPNQNTFGHMGRWLVHDEYRQLAELPDGGETAWGYRKDPYSLCPTDKGSLSLVSGMLDELLPHFASRMVNVGLDETIDLGYGRSKKVCDKKGKGRVYLDFLLEIHKMVVSHGRRMQFWGDIILHHPELIGDLPKDVIAMEWGYEADHPFAKDCKQFAKSGIEFYVCPGTSSWNTLVGRTDVAIDNIVSAAKNGRKYDAIGMLNTDWGDNGHWQPLSVSWLGYMVGAAVSWNAKSDVREHLAGNLSLHAFNDRTLKVGQAFYDLGNLYQCFEKRPSNQNVQWQILFNPMDSAGVAEGIKKSEIDDLISRTKKIAKAVKGEKMQSPDAAIVREELAHLFHLMELAASVGANRLGGEPPKALDEAAAAIKAEHDKVWLLRNRPGGMNDSLSYLRFAEKE